MSSASGQRRSRGPQQPVGLTAETRESDRLRSTRDPPWRWCYDSPMLARRGTPTARADCGRKTHPAQTGGGSSLRWREVIERGEEAGAEEAVSESEPEADSEAVARGALPICRCRGVRGETSRVLGPRAVAPRINPAHHEPKPRADGPHESADRRRQHHNRMAGRCEGSGRESSMMSRLARPSGPADWRPRTPRSRSIPPPSKGPHNNVVSGHGRASFPAVLSGWRWLARAPSVRA